MNTLLAKEKKYMESEQRISELEDEVIELKNQLAEAKNQKKIYKIINWKTADLCVWIVEKNLKSRYRQFSPRTAFVMRKIRFSTKHTLQVPSHNVYYVLFLEA